ncbi:MAG: Hint domain-containing protein [Rhodosalinus sp.]|uniref:Hint domain-containing protein n=1 Tax=Rhodosalinus sp. TaxID=2047741 RepID=UPI00397D5F24
MPTTYNDQFYAFDPANPPPAGAAASFVSLDLVDRNDDGDIDRFNGDSVGGVDVVNSWPGDTVTIDVPGTGNVTYTGTTFYLANGGRVFTPTDGQVLENGTFVASTFVNAQGPLLVDDLGPVCFTPGTLIDVPGGRCPVDRLSPGDLVSTRDHGARPLRQVARARFVAAGAAAPVRFARGVLGNDRAFEVSQRHRMLLTGWRAELLFGEAEVLVPALHLLDGRRIRLRTGGAVDYIHLIFDRHEIVTADGIPSESCYPAPALMARADRGAQAELRRFFPSLQDPDVPPPAARRVLRAHEARLVA